MLAGGKSGGHVFPLLAVGSELEARGWRLVLIGAADSLEERLAAQSGLGFRSLPARPFLGRGLLARLQAGLVLLRSAWHARRLLRRLSARVVVSSGGFVAAPSVVGAWLARCPILLIEPNARAGLSNRVLSRLARVAVTAHPQAAKDLHCASEVLGVPVRGAFWRAAPFEGSQVERLLVLGGSQGALRLNQALPRALRALTDLEIVVRHQTGAALFEATEERYRELFEPLGEGRFRLGKVQVQLLPFIDDMPSALAWSHVVISRAGALTLAEICAAGRAALLVPLVAAAGGHQVDNARALESQQAAIVLDEAGLEGLATVLRNLVEEPTRVAALGRAARRMGHEHAAADIAERVTALSGREAA